MLAQALSMKNEPVADPLTLLLQIGMSPWHDPAEQTGYDWWSGTSTGN